LAAERIANLLSQTANRTVARERAFRPCGDIVARLHLQFGKQ
jgi:hypothetical protein